MEQQLVKYENGKQLRKESGRLALGLIVYQIAMLLFYCLTLMVQIIVTAVQKRDFSDAMFDKTLDFLIDNSGVGYLIAIPAGFFILYLIFRKLDTGSLFVSNQKMTIKHFFMLLSVFMATQLVFSVAGEGGERIFNLFGLSIKDATEQATSLSTTWSMFLYAGFLGPVVEELIFRGFCLRTLQKHGKAFAIIVSAVLFGLFHMNLPQGIFAAAVGIVLGYVAMEYSIIWSMILHMVNNCLFGDVLGYLLKPLPEKTQEGIWMAILIAFFIAGIVIIIRYHKKALSYFKKVQSGKCRYLFLSVCTVIYFILTIGATCLSITKL